MRRRSRTRGRRGDHLVQDDRTGFTIWASEAQKEWNGALVHKSVWEARHPQDFVRGVRDDMRVDPARPEPAIEDLPSIGPRTAFFVLAAGIGDYGITVSDFAIFTAGDWIRLFLDSGETMTVRVTSAPIRIDSMYVTIDSRTLFIDSPGTLEVSSRLLSTAAVGNLIINMSNRISADLTP